MAKPKLATTWLTGCSGCHISLVDLDETLLDVVGQVEITACPPLTDVKEAPEVDVALVEGAVATEENEEVLRRLRERAGKLVALGTCACFGGIPGLRNLHPLAQALQRAYVDTESTVHGVLPCSEEIPRLQPFVRPIDEVVKVDGYIPGCPPTPKMLAQALAALLSGQELVWSRRNLCEECPREHRAMKTTDFEFISQNVSSVCELDEIDPKLCFLEQGVPCLGVATREGCEARCLAGNMPCRGCMGPTPDAKEQGAKWVNAVASLLPAGTLSFLDDVMGLGCRFALPASLSPHWVGKEDEK
ncbi:MAG: F420-nonreducing hydrogenase [Planctomycetes bacterium]|nr:F420-nonreducing hydrogenase [Planctomycetota bacterium]